MIKVDDDDLVAADVVDRLQEKYPGSVTMFIMPMGRGYLDLARYLNTMSDRSSADWLLLLGDNTKIVTHHWDEWLVMSLPINPWVWQAKMSASSRQTCQGFLSCVGRQLKDHGLCHSDFQLGSLAHRGARRDPVLLRDPDHIRAQDVGSSHE